MTSDSPISVRVSHRYTAPPERVYDAWLDPALVGRWMFGLGGVDERVVRIEVDARVGGTFSFLVLRDGVEIDHIGTYLELERPRLLAFTWAVRGQGDDDGGSRVRVELAPLGTGTVLTLTHEMHPKWADFADRTAQGWRRILGGLERAFA